MNQGAWYSIQDPLRRLVSLSMFGAELRYIGRTPSASVSAGYTRPLGEWPINET